jgi:hypothetical protein
MTTPQLDQTTLKRLLHYDPQTGLFVWRERDDVPNSWNGRYAGKVAGYDWHVPRSASSYRSIRIFNWPFLGHRLAFLYMTGEWPPHDVDHIDMNGLNNRWSNLRMATKTQNSGNRLTTRANRTGFKNVSLHKPTGRYRAYISLNGRQKWLGYHDTPEAAYAAYCEAARAKYGEFARI